MRWNRRRDFRSRLSTASFSHHRQNVEAVLGHLIHGSPVQKKKKKGKKKGKTDIEKQYKKRNKLEKVNQKKRFDSVR